MPSRRYVKKPRKGNQAEETMLENISRVEALEQFEKDIAPELRRAISEKWSAERIYKHFQEYAAARAVTIALTDTDSSKALTAIKEVMDRGVGKPSEKVEIETRYKNMSDQELKALLDSKKKIVESTKKPN